MVVNKMGYRLWTFGYGQYSSRLRIEKLLSSFHANGISNLIDIRHSPCASQLDPKSNYGPRPWNLQASGGIAYELEAVGIQYTWVPQLGNPQKRDPKMSILRAELAEPDAPWPINLGLIWLADTLKSASSDQRFGILCACEAYDKCHRQLVAETLRDRHFGGELEIHSPR
jgi:hypothetical protein